MLWAASTERVSGQENMLGFKIRPSSTYSSLLSSFDGGQSVVVSVLVDLVDLMLDLRAVFAAINPQECLSSLGSHVSGWMGCV